MARPDHAGPGFLHLQGRGGHHRPHGLQIIWISSRLYKQWAGMRLPGLVAWVQHVQLPEKYAGVPGGGAEMAWWHVGITREKAYHVARDVLAGALDSYTCF